jgi:hypothetical protein
MAASWLSGRLGMALFWRRCRAIAIAASHLEHGFVFFGLHVGADEPFPHRREEGGDYHRVELRANLLPDLVQRFLMSARCR